MILFEGYAGDDSGIMVQNKEHSILDCKSFLKGIIDKTIISKLPIVYVSRTNIG